MFYYIYEQYIIHQILFNNILKMFMTFCLFFGFIFLNFYYMKINRKYFDKLIIKKNNRIVDDMKKTQSQNNNEILKIQNKYYNQLNQHMILVDSRTKNINNYIGKEYFSLNQQYSLIYKQFNMEIEKFFEIEQC